MPHTLNSEGQATNVGSRREDAVDEDGVTGFIDNPIRPRAVEPEAAVDDFGMLSAHLLNRARRSKDLYSSVRFRGCDDAEVEATQSSI